MKYSTKSVSIVFSKNKKKWINLKTTRMEVAINEKLMAISGITGTVISSLIFSLNSNWKNHLKLSKYNLLKKITCTYLNNLKLHLSEHHGFMKSLQNIV